MEFIKSIFCESGRASRQFADRILFPFPFCLFERLILQQFVWTALSFESQVYFGYRQFCLRRIEQN